MTAADGQPAVTYDVLTLDGKIIETRVTGGRLNELLTAIDEELAVRVHAEDHTRRPRRPGDPHTDARPVTGMRLFAGLNYMELRCLSSRLSVARDDISYLEFGDIGATGERPGPAPEGLRAVDDEISAVEGLVMDARGAVLAARRKPRRAVAA